MGPDLDNLRRQADYLDRQADDLRRQADDLRRIADNIVRHCRPPTRRRLSFEEEREKRRTSDRAVHVSRIPRDLPISDLVERCIDSYGAVSKTHSGPNWVNIEFIKPEDQQKCLDDAAYLREQFGVVVEPRIIIIKE